MADAVNSTRFFFVDVQWCNYPVFLKEDPRLAPDFDKAFVNPFVAGAVLETDVSLLDHTVGMGGRTHRYQTVQSLTDETRFRVVDDFAIPEGFRSVGAGLPVEANDWQTYCQEKQRAPEPVQTIVPL